ncbi:hypothetical protein LSAT2_025501 [Lamellibrachia satsuma]|nr:hypothetical protein LSAT2_025501 [Lamellibrachia satsuma]
MGYGPPVQPCGPPVPPYGPPVPPYGPPVQPYGPPVPPYGPPVQPYVVPGASFNAGARFDAVAPASIPPPAPGYAPSQAQQAAMQGHAVAPTQQQSNYFTMGAGGQVKMLFDEPRLGCRT